MTYKVIQWGTGNVGRHAIRGVLAHPETELVGARVYRKQKAGQDVGEICGIGPVGVVATDDVAAILSMKADCVVYSPLLPVIGDVCALLESGKNVVTPVGWFYPGTLPTAEVARIDGACNAGRATLHGTGINPGGMSDRFVLAASSLCRGIRRIVIEEYSDIRNYPAPDVVKYIMLMGAQPEKLRKSSMLDLLGNGFRQSIEMVANALGLALDGFEASHDLAIADATIEGPCGIVIEPGTIAGQRFTWTGTRSGRPVITTRVHWVMGFDHMSPRWDFAEDGWLIAIDADPPVRCRWRTSWPAAVAPAADEAAAQYRRDHGIIATAQHLVNSIPYVCRAEPGIKTYLDLPLISGRYEGDLAGEGLGDALLSRGLGSVG
jgi:hypothetical protein